MIKLGQMVLKGVNWVHIDKIRSNGLSQLGTQKIRSYGLERRNQVNWVHNNKIRSNGLERSQLV